MTPTLDGRLDGGETWQWTCDYTVPAHVDGELNDPFTNTAAADGDDVDGDALAQATSDQTSVDIAHDSGTLAIVKSAPTTPPTATPSPTPSMSPTPRAPTARRPRT